MADSKLTSFAPLTKRDPVVDSLVSKLNRAASWRIRGSKNDRRTPLEPNESPCYLGASVLDDLCARSPRYL